MKFTETRLPGAFVIEIEPIEDERGFFARSWCAREFAARGLNACLAQCDISFNTRKGILRGMHYQAKPHEEAKLVRCTRGALYDVALDLRPDSPTYKSWVGVELTAENRKMLYIPEGCAHGFQTLEPETEVFYQMSACYAPGAARGVRWDDPAFGIEWPFAERILSDKDASYPLFTAQEAEITAPAQKPITRAILWGAGGHAKVLRECLHYAAIEVVALFDNNPNVPSPFADVPVYYGKPGFEAWLAESEENRATGFLVAIGGDRGRDRLEIQDYLASRGLTPLVARHPTAFVAADAQVGAGSHVLAHTSICSDTVVGRGCLINTGAIADHECRIGNGVHLCPGAHLAGCIEVGDCALIGTGAVVLPRKRIGERAIVGAGAVVTKDVAPYTVVVGNPARVLRTLAPESSERT